MVQAINSAVEPMVSVKMNIGPSAERLMASIVSLFCVVLQHGREERKNEKEEREETG